MKRLALLITSALVATALAGCESQCANGEDPVDCDELEDMEPADDQTVGDGSTTGDEQGESLDRDDDGRNDANPYEDGAIHTGDKVLVSEHLIRFNPAYAYCWGWNGEPAEGGSDWTDPDHPATRMEDAFGNYWWERQFSYNDGAPFRCNFGAEGVVDEDGKVIGDFDHWADLDAMAIVGNGDDILPDPLYWPNPDGTSALCFTPFESTEGNTLLPGAEMPGMCDRTYEDAEGWQ